MQTVKANGAEIPALGFGVFRMSDAEVERGVGKGGPQDPERLVARDRPAVEEKPPHRLEIRARHGEQGAGVLPLGRLVGEGGRRGERGSRGHGRLVLDGSCPRIDRGDRWLTKR